MRTAILSVVFAAFRSAAPQQDPSQPASGHHPGQQKPSDPPLIRLCAAATTIQLGVPYNSQSIASGGSGVYQFAISGALPAGIALNPATGAISGTPTADGTFSYTVQVTDSDGAMRHHGQHALHPAIARCAPAPADCRRTGSNPAGAEPLPPDR